MFKKLSAVMVAAVLAVALCFSVAVTPTAHAASASVGMICPSASHTGGAMSTLTQKSFTITCPGALIGDFVQVTAPTSLLLLTVTAYVSAANTVTVVIVNGSSGSITDPTTVYYAKVVSKYTSP